MVKLGREINVCARGRIWSGRADQAYRRPGMVPIARHVLAFDWNASGLTTILTAALKEAIRGHETDFGIVICGGKGKTSRKTPDEIRAWGERTFTARCAGDNLYYNSKMSAKVDSALVQDGFQLYHHRSFSPVAAHGQLSNRG